MSETMSGPATRPNVVDASDAFTTMSSEPVQLPTFEARLLIANDEGETIVSVTAFGSSRVVDQIMHASTDAFREEAER